MKVQEGEIGRIFIMRLEDGDLIPGCIEQFALEKKIAAGYVIFVGDIRSGQIVSGPRRQEITTPEPIVLPIDGVHEAAGVGTIAPNADGKPVLHIHAALGRAGNTMTGCLRPGVTTWLVGEVVLIEIIGVDVARLKDEVSGFELLQMRD